MNPDSLVFQSHPFTTFTTWARPQGHLFGFLKKMLCLWLLYFMIGWWPLLYVQLIGIKFLIMWLFPLHTGMEESCFCFFGLYAWYSVSFLLFLFFASDAPRYGMGSETPMHPSRTPLHSYMTPMRDYAGRFLSSIVIFLILEIYMLSDNFVD